MDPTEFGSHVSTLKCQCSGLILAKSGDSEDQICSLCGLQLTAEEIDKLENEYEIDLVVLDKLSK